jgi:hypothetical protein
MAYLVLINELFGLNVLYSLRNSILINLANELLKGKKYYGKVANWKIYC